MANQGQVRKRKIGRSKLRYRDTKRETADSTIGTQRHERRDTRFSLSHYYCAGQQQVEGLEVLWKYRVQTCYYPRRILVEITSCSSEVQGGVRPCGNNNDNNNNNKGVVVEATEATKTR